MMLVYLQETREKTSHQRDLNAAVHLHVHFTGCELNRLRASDIRAYVEARKPVVKPARVNRELGLLLAAINYYARREWDWDIPNPVSGRKLREPEGRARWISRSQSEALIRAAEAESNAPHLADFIRLTLHTGCRKQELLGLEWARVNLSANLFYLEAQHTKTARRRSIPLNQSAKAVILNRARFRAKNCPGSPWVFAHKDGSRIQDVKRSFTTACERVRIDDFRIHDLRHTCAAWLMSAGVPLAEVKALLGHTTVKMTERYAHLAPENVRAAVAKLDGSHTLVTPGENLDRNELTLVR
jgi:integrase